jgi:hypothetical protein
MESPGFDRLHVDTVRYVGVNDQYFAHRASCRRLVYMQVAGVQLEDGDGHRVLWDEFYPNCPGPRSNEREVFNVFLPKHEGGFRLPEGVSVKPNGRLHVKSFYAPSDPFKAPILTADVPEEGGEVFIFRPVDMRVAATAVGPRPIPDLGALFPVAEYHMSIWVPARTTLVGLEDVPWDRIGVADPGTSKEEWFRGMLEELVEPIIGVAKGTYPMDRLQRRVKFLSHEEYRAQVGNEEYETDLIPLEGLLDRFAVEA